MRALVVQTVVLPFLMAGLAFTASAQSTARDQGDNPGNSPGVITEGSGNTSIGGVPAARKGDAANGAGSVVGGSPNVFINGRPAATVGDRTGCGGIVVGSGGGVFINGKPAARTGDLTTGCPGKSP
jgi:uncharacterized Zn-binding protein involved in type VI secretion